MALDCDSGAERRCFIAAVPPVLLLDRVRDRIRLEHYSIRTEQAYCDWIRRFIIFHGKRHPSAFGATEVEAFLTSLTVAGRMAASSRPRRLHDSQSCSREEVAQVLARLDGVHRLIGALL